MMSMPIEIVIKVKSFEDVDEALSNIKKIKEANPKEVIKTTLEIDLRD